MTHVSSASNARRVCALLSFAAVFALAVLAALAQAPPPPGQTTLQVQVPLVVEDVVVLDSHNQPVHGLKASDFILTDDGKPVTPKDFDEHATAAPAPEPPSILPPAEGPNVFTNRTAVPSGVPLNVLLVDALNTPIDAQAQVHIQMIKFLSNLPPGTPIAIYGLSNHLHLLQGFTTNPAVLKAIMGTTSPGAKTPNLINQNAAGGPDAQSDALDAYGLINAGNEGQLGTILEYQMFLSQIQNYQDAQRTMYTLQAFEELARYLSTLPGRKNVIWFSGSFPLDIVPTSLESAASLAASTSTSSDVNTASAMFGSSSQASFGSLVRNTDDLLRRSQVAIYPVDARGLYTDASMDASSNTHLNTTVTTQEVLAGGKGAGMGSGSISMAADSTSNLASQSTEEHATMNQMADETGGKAFYNNGDLGAAVKSAMDLGANYYTLAYTPPSGKWDEKPHKIEVKVDQPGLHLSYRRRYYADGPQQDKNGQLLPQASLMMAAMMHGAPESNGLVFNVSATTADNTTGQMAPGSKPDPKLMQPPYKTCTLTATLDIHNVSMPVDASGAHAGSIEFVMIVYDANGDVVNQGARVGHVVLPPDRYQMVLDHGLNIRQSIDVPAKGVYFIRVGFHDPASDRVGAVEFPVAALTQPQPVAQSVGPN